MPHRIVATRHVARILATDLMQPRCATGVDGRARRVAMVLHDTYSGGMEDLEQPRCPECGTVMRDDPAGFRCGGCGHLDDRSAELAAVEIPPDFDGPGILGG